MPNRSDPAYLKARRKFAGTVMMMQSIVLMTADPDDDAFLQIFLDNPYGKFDEWWDLKHPVKAAGETLMRSRVPVAPKPGEAGQSYLDAHPTPPSPPPTGPILQKLLMECMSLNKETLENSRKILEVVTKDSAGEVSLGALV